MEKKNNRSILVVVMALIAVVAVLMIVFLMNPAEQKEEIILPSAQLNPLPEQQPETSTASDFLELDIGNAIEALQSLTRPQFYHQSYRVSLLNGMLSAERDVEIWYNNGLIHAEVKLPYQLKSVLTDGTSLWIWYDTDLQPVQLTLDSSITMEDVLGLPGFDYLQTLTQSTVVDVGYELLDESRRCIFLCTQLGKRAERYWIDLETGLLYQHDVLEDSQQIYTVTQRTFDRLAPGDEAYAGRFCLPDGTEPFTAAE